jgi:ribosome-binding factor A
VYREVSLIVQTTLTDSRLDDVTITDVEVSRDLRHAKVFYSVLDDDNKVEIAKEALDEAAPFIRKQLGDTIVLKYTPELHFYYDDSMAVGARMEELLKQIKHGNQSE